MPTGCYPRTEEMRKKHSLACKGKSGIYKRADGWTNSGSFRKGEHRSIDTEIKKGERISPDTEFKRGQLPQNFKGYQKHALGYVWTYTPSHPFRGKNNVVLEHRLVVEKCLGRYLEPEEVVHHVNEIKDDNRPINLMAFISKSAHVRFHANPDNVKPEEIIFDGRKF